MMYQNYRRALDECPGGMMVIPVQGERGRLAYECVSFEDYYYLVGEEASYLALRGWDGVPDHILGDEREFPDNEVCRRYVEDMSTALQDYEKALLTFEETMED